MQEDSDSASKQSSVRRRLCPWPPAHRAIVSLPLSPPATLAFALFLEHVEFTPYFQVLFPPPGVIFAHPACMGLTPTCLQVSALSLNLPSTYYLLPPSPSSSLSHFVSSLPLSRLKLPIYSLVYTLSLCSPLAVRSMSGGDLLVTFTSESLLTGTVSGAWCGPRGDLLN